MAANKQPDATIYLQMSHIYRVTRHPSYNNLNSEQRNQVADSHWAYLKNDPNWPSSFERFKTEHKRYVDSIQGNKCLFSIKYIFMISKYAFNLKHLWINKNR